MEPEHIGLASVTQKAAHDFPAGKPVGRPGGPEMDALTSKLGGYAAATVPRLGKYGIIRHAARECAIC